MERELMSTPCFLLASCRIFYHPYHSAISMDHACFKPHGLAPRLKNAPTSIGSRGEKHVPPRTESEQKNDNMTSEYTDRALCAKSSNTTQANVTTRNSLKL